MQPVRHEAVNPLPSPAPSVPETTQLELLKASNQQLQQENEELRSRLESAERRLSTCTCQRALLEEPCEWAILSIRREREADSPFLQLPDVESATRLVLGAKGLRMLNQTGSEVCVCPFDLLEGWPTTQKELRLVLCSGEVLCCKLHQAERVAAAMQAKADSIAAEAGRQMMQEMMGLVTDEAPATRHESESSVVDEARRLMMERMMDQMEMRDASTTIDSLAAHDAERDRSDPSAA